MANIAVVKASNRPQLESCFAIRLDVFVREQGCPVEEEFDRNDETAVHVLALDGKTPVGTGRFYDEGGSARIGRMAVLASHRGRGAGKNIMEALLAHARAAGLPRAHLHAQTHARGFYERFGFVAEGGLFDECGIEHIRMTRPL